MHTVRIVRPKRSGTLAFTFDREALVGPGGAADTKPTRQVRRLRAMMPSMQRTLCAVALAALVAGCVGANSGPAPGSDTASAPLPSATSPLPSGETGLSGSGGVGPAATIVALPGATPGPPAPSTPAPTAAPLPLVAVRYRLVDQLGRPLFCDPDFYPVARVDESALAAERFPAIRADAPTYLAITAHLGIDPSLTPTAAQVLAIYRAWKMLRALVLQPALGAYSFDYIAAAAPGAQSGWQVTGTIDAAGSIHLARRAPSGPPPCPICLARGTLIATPAGAIPVQDLRPGRAVWTTDAAGARMVGAVLRVASTPVAPTHEVVHLVLSDGRSLDASPGHPLPDGRRLGDLAPGDLVDGARVVSAELVPYAGGATFDLLPSGPTGTYWANGVLLGSTLGPSP